MFAGLLLVACAVAFYAFVGTAPGDLVKVALALAWLALALAIPVSIIIELMR